jgi:hypothetical protein
MIVEGRGNKDWFEIVKSSPGRPENIKIKNNLCGPWIILGQNDPTCATWADQVAITDPSHTFKLEWGSVVYQRSDDGKLELCGYWYDTSD